MKSISFPLADPGVTPVPRTLGKIIDEHGEELGIRIGVRGDFAPPVDLRFDEPPTREYVRRFLRDLLEQDRRARREIRRRYRKKHGGPRRLRGSGQDPD